MAANTFLVDIDLSGNSLLRPVIHNIATAPVIGKGGIYYSTSATAGVGDKLYLNIGTSASPSWKAFLTDTVVLSQTISNDVYTITSTSSNNASSITLGLASTTVAGLLSKGDKDILDKLNSGTTRAIRVSDTDASSWSFVSTSGTLGTPADTLLPTQKAVKTYVDAEIAKVNTTVTGSLIYKGGYNANTNSPGLTTPIAGILTGHTYVVTVGGTFFGEAVEPGDMLIAVTNGPTGLAGWTVVNKNIPDVLSIALTGYVKGANSQLAATDSILAAFGKVQGQLDGKQATLTFGVALGNALSAAAALGNGDYLLANATGIVSKTVANVRTELLGSVAVNLFTGSTLSTTPATGDNSTKIATTAFVASAIGATTFSTSTHLAATGTLAITHNLNSTNVIATVYEISTNKQIFVETVITDANTVTFNFNGTIAANTLKFVIQE